LIPLGHVVKELLAVIFVNTPNRMTSRVLEYLYCWMPWAGFKRLVIVTLFPLRKVGRQRDYEAWVME